jgi:hypothetical protein
MMAVFLLLKRVASFLMSVCRVDWLKHLLYLIIQQACATLENGITFIIISIIFINYVYIWHKHKCMWNRILSQFCRILTVV